MHFASKPLRAAISSVASRLIAAQLRKCGAVTVGYGVLVAMALGICAQSAVAAKTGTTTALAITSGGSVVTSVTSGSVVTLIASVKAGTTAISTGQVNFCDATASYCTDIHLLGTAQLTSKGTATLKFRPGIGSHSYKAVFVGTNTDAGTSSGELALAVTGAIGPFATATATAETGSWGNYKFSGTVTEVGGTGPLTGNVSFLDTGNANAVLGTSNLGTSMLGLTWLNSQTALAGLGPEFIAVGDFNGDGVLDVAVTNARGNTVSIFTGHGDGTFSNTATLATGGDPCQIVAADFNGDGILDLAVVDSEYAGAVSIFLGNGDGTFTPMASAPSAGAEPFSVVADDFNGDGIPDLAISSPFTGTVSILLGNGDGTFVTSQVSVTSFSGIGAIAVGDFNGDGKADLAVGSAVSPAVEILTGNGDGTFLAGGIATISSYAVSIAVGDFNGDGKLDLALGNGKNVVGETTTLSILLGNGDGTFTPGPSNPTVEDDPASIVVGDFNQDGIPDLAVPTYSDTVQILLGNGDGTFTSSPVSASTGDSPEGLAVGDFNGDGRSDIAAANYFGGTVTLLLTEPTQTASTATTVISPQGAGIHLLDGSYSGDSSYNSSVSGTTALWGPPPATTTTLTITSGGSQPTTVSSGSVVTLTATVEAGTSVLTLGQVNFCDAKAKDCTDIHLVGSASLSTNGTASFKLIPGPGQHSYKAVLAQFGYGATSQSGAVALTVTPPAISPIQTTTSIAQSGSIGSYTLTATVSETGGSAVPTGIVSFLDTSYSNLSLATAPLGSAAAGLYFPISYSYPVSDVGYMYQALGDFNGDGRQDIAAINANTEAIDVLLSNGDGTFASAPSITTSIYPYAIAVGDFNHDGKLDIAVAFPQTSVTSPGQLAIYLGNGDGTFTAAGVTTYPGAANSIFVADLNGDGKLDLVIGAYYNTVILLGNGDGTFASPVTVGPTGAIAVGDLNGDGIPDMILGENTSTAAVYLGNGDGSFSPNGFTFSGFLGAGHAVIADFNGDGIPDVGIAGLDYSAVNVFLGIGDGTFTAIDASANPSINEPTAIAVADLNSDGKPDLIVTNENSYSGNSMNPDLTFMLGNGDGTFTAIPGDTRLNGTWSVFAADFNGDGIPDLSVGTNDGISILLTEPMQTVTATASGVSPTGPAPHLVEANYPGDSNYVASASATTPLSVQVATPVISPVSGTITSAQYVTLSDATPGATIYYQTSGASYTNGYVQYKAPIPLEGSGTLNISVYATETGYQQSSYASAAYTFNFTTPAATPVISLASGSYPSAQTVTITDSSPGAQIYYTTNGTYPYVSSNLYLGPITVSTSEIVTAVAYAPGYAISTFASAQYLIDTSSTRFIYTIAGSDTPGYTGDGEQATFAELNGPQGVAVDSAGNVYMTDSADNVVRKVTVSTGIITTIAGTGVAGHNGDNGPATSAELWAPNSIVVDAVGNVFVGETGDYVVRRIDAVTGNITTFAGNPTGTGSLDGPATSYALNGIAGIALDSLDTNLYIAEEFSVVAVNLGNGLITQPPGQTNYPSFGLLSGIAVDSGQNIYVSDDAYSVVWKINQSSGTTTIFAGSLYGASGGDGGPATSAGLYYPVGLSVDKTGNVYIADEYDSAIREVNTSGIINTIAGVLHDPYTSGGDGSPATDVGIFYPQAIAADSAGNIYFGDQGSYRIRKITLPTTPPTSVTAAPMFSLAAGSYANSETLTITDATPGAEIYVSLSGNAPTTTSQGYHGPIDITGTVTVQAVALALGKLPSAQVSATYTIATSPSAVISTVAGDGRYGILGLGGAAVNAEIGTPQAVTLDGSGDLYIADSENNVVWMVAASTGNISIVAGPGTYGSLGDGGPAVDAELSAPSGVAVDKVGDLYIADTNNGRIRKVAAQTGVITTVAGPGTYTTLGDGGPATSAYLGYPYGIALDSAGDLYIADSITNRVRRIAAQTGIISTVAGEGTVGQLGDGGLATAATLSYPEDVALDSAGNLYISDSDDARIRKVDQATGIITTVAGNGRFGDTGDEVPAVAAEISIGEGIAVDGKGNIYLSNWPDGIRKVDAATGFISTIAGDGYSGYAGDGGAATMAEIYNPQGLTLDAKGALYIADAYNFRIRKVTFQAQQPVTLSSMSLAFGSITVGTTSYSQQVTLTNTGTAALAITSIALTGANASSFVFANTCGTSVAAGASCTIHGHFAPTAAGAQTASITITDNAAGSPQTITLTGMGADTTASLSVSSLSYGIAKVGTTTASQQLTLTNTGSAALLIGSITLTGPDASSFVFGNTCGTSVAVGASCIIHGHFAPVAQGTMTAAIAIYDSVSGSPQTVALTGTGVNPTTVTLSSTSLSFGFEQVGVATPSQSVTLTNTGASTLGIASIALTGTNASSFVFGNTCGTSVAAGAICTIHGHFDPTALGALTAAITITDTATGSPQSIALSGTGANSTTISLSATSVSFGVVEVGTTTASQSVTLTNTGAGPFIISSFAVTGANASSFVFANSCGASLSPGGTCTIHGHFTPTTTGALTAAVTLTDNATNSPQSIALSGTGVTPTTVSLSATSLAFGTETVGSSTASKIVTLTNTGTSTLGISSIVVAGANASSFVFGNTCGASLAAGANCTIHGHFAPTTTGALTATITITDTATGSPQTITLSGTGQ